VDEGLVSVPILQARTDDPRGVMDSATRHGDDAATKSAERQHRSALKMSDRLRL
jgi:hypothetical protein